MDAANHSLSNDTKPPQTSLILNTNQLDELTNQLKILSIDDLSINKIVENLKTIKTEVSFEKILLFLNFQKSFLFSHMFLRNYKIIFKKMDCLVSC